MYIFKINMPRHDNLSDLKQSLTEQSEQSDQSNQIHTKRDACVPIGICGVFVFLGLLCGYLIHESYLIEDGSI